MQNTGDDEKEFGKNALWVVGKLEATFSACLPLSFVEYIKKPPKNLGWFFDRGGKNLTLH